MNEKKQELFRDVLTKPYDHQAYVRFLQEFFNKIQLVAPGKFNKAYDNAAKFVEGGLNSPVSIGGSARIQP